MDSLLARGFVDVYRRLVGEEPNHYTFWTAWDRKANLGWRLDYQIATPKTAAAAVAGRISAGELYSDHAPLLIEYRLE